MAKKTQTQVQADFKHMIEEAKRIKRKHPSKKWTACIKAASKKVYK